jgi:hypothetical protein
LTLSNYFNVTDSDGSPMVDYQVQFTGGFPGSGYLIVNGVTQQASGGTLTINGVTDPASPVIDIPAAQWAQTSFVTASIPQFSSGNANYFEVRVSDGSWWSQWANPVGFIVMPNSPPQVTTGLQIATPGQSLPLSNLFQVTDADGDSMTKYELWDGTAAPNSGHFAVNGVAQAAGTVIDITAAQLASTTFIAGASGTSDSLQIRAFDGINWSAADNASWAPFHVTVT